MNAIFFAREAIQKEKRETFLRNLFLMNKCVRIDNSTVECNELHQQHLIQMRKFCHNMHCDSEKQTRWVFR